MVEPSRVLANLKITALAILLAVSAINTSAWAEDSISLTFEASSANQRSASRYHIVRARTAAGLSAPLEGAESSRSALPGGHAAVPMLANVPKPGFYEGDVSNPGHGNTLAATAMHPILVNCAPGDDSCWGNPTAFLSDLAGSKFIHLTDQYTGKKGAFSVGTSVNVKATLHDDCHIGGSNPCLTDGDIQALVNTAAQTLGAGYGHFYHVFLPQGVDECMTDASGNILGCYSPDVLNAFAFCGYHSYVDASAGHIIYSVEPYQAVTIQIPAGPQVSPCGAVPLAAPNHSVNGFESDSTDSTLAHETFEAISDPDIDAWFDLSSSSLFGSEIGDICDGPPLFDNSGNVLGGAVEVVKLKRNLYASQLMYSNRYHGCAPR